MTALLAALGWCTGIAVGTIVEVHPWWLPLVGVAVLVTGFVARSRPVAVWAWVLALVLLGTWRASAHTEARQDDPLANVGPAVSVVGRVADLPAVSNGRESYPLEVLWLESPAVGAIDFASGQEPRVLVRSAGLGVDYDDVIRIRGNLGEPRSRPGYPLSRLLRGRGMLHVLDAAHMEVLGSGSDRLPWLVRGRRFLESSIRTVVPEPQASLVVGVVLGNRSALAADLKHALAATGTSHIVAVSGFNVAVVAAVAHAVANRVFSRPWSLLPAALAVWLYTLVVGAPASAIRAALMATLAFLATAAGRLPDPITSVALAAAGMLAWDPGLLLDLGFSLSVLATAGLVLFVAPISDRLPALPRVARESFAVAIATHIATLPLVLATFHTLSVVSPIVNLAVGLFVPWLMLLGALVAAFGWVPILGLLPGWGATAVAWSILLIVDGAARLPWAVLYTGRLPVWLAVAWYAGLALWAVAGSPDTRALVGRRHALIGVASAVMLVLSPVAAALAAPPLRSTISLLDVNGTSAFVRSANGHAALIAGATSPAALVASVASRLGFWERRLDLAVVTDGSERVLEAYRQAAARYPPRVAVLPVESRMPGVAALASDGDLGVNGLEPVAGARVDLGDGASVEIVDVRDVGGRTVVDMVVRAEGLAVWLPGPGPPSPRWQSIEQEGEAVVIRLPTASSPWLELAGRAARAVIADRPLAGGAGRSITLDHRSHGAIDVTLDGEAPTLVPERCPSGDSCAIRLE